ncbi:MAG: hypothetical protein MOB07_10715 [Acidobacteria bacterium]|nr:hypothetical protein [Acidobacteriota bacterium]
MSKLIPQPDEIRDALERHLEPGERLLYAAYGLQQSTPLLILAIFGLMIPVGLITLLFARANTWLLGVIAFFVIWGGLMISIIPLFRKDYLVGLTDRRLLILRVKTPVLTINLQATLSFAAYPLDQLSEAQAGFSPLRVFIKLKRHGLNLQFGGRGLNENYQQAVEIARALDQASTEPRPLYGKSA